MMGLGAQLYTVRAFTQSERDLAETLRRIREIGYREVQISAVGAIAPERIRVLCDEHELDIVLTHTSPERILNDTEAVIREHDVLGCRYIGIGGLPERYRSEGWFARFGADFKEPAGKLAAAGKLLMYHNHDFEFQRLGERRMIECLLEDFPPEELGFTLDTYWVQAAGGDPVQWIERLRDRIHCVHLKDMDMVGGKPVMAPVLEGNMNFDRILAALKDNTVAKHLLVEQDICQESPFECLAKSYRNLVGKGCC